ncbi:MAG: hypothetical protein EOP34_01645 [Rickettsiales bacterium]|nr:MAG: hypothetical protein EOP34_01645 [Rickettsiales bacterium]
MEKISIHNDFKKFDDIQDSIRKYDLRIKNIPNKKRKDLSVAWAYPIYMNILNLPESGFKIHISATIINASSIIKKLVPYLLLHNIAFKIIGSLNNLKKMNQGSYGYSQIGKFITVYPINNKEAHNYAYKFDEILSGFESIKIPSDLQLLPNSIIYYRYGSFKKNNRIKLPNGLFIKDKRHPKHIIPEGIENIFPVHIDKQNNSLLANRIIILKVIRQTAKGLVFLGFDLITSKSIIIKEGRKLSVMEDSGIDGYDRLRWSSDVQEIIEKYKITPSKIFYHEEKYNNFLGFEYFRSRSLSKILLSKRKLFHEKKIDILTKIIECIHNFHIENIYINDISPDNILINGEGILKIIDFEYCIKDNYLAFPGWEMGTPGFAPKAKFMQELNLSDSKKYFLRDIFAIRQLIFALMNQEWYRAIVKGTHLEEEDWGIRFYSEKPLFKNLFDKISLNPLDYKSVLDFLPFVKELYKLEY